MIEYKRKNILGGYCSMDMDKVLEFIENKRLINPEEIVAVAVSGGRDSMALLHFLHENADALDCKVVAINVDHCLRENSARESAFVKEYCAEHRIHLYNFKVDVRKLSEDKKIGIEAAAREARYGIFEALLKKGVADKIALGHHISDQVETVLENILRGAGLGGAKGMEPIRDGVYIRPFLETAREDINKYVYDHQIPYVDDESNVDIAYTRNFLRNEIIPALKERFKSAEKNLLAFSRSCADDNEYINEQIDDNGIMYFDDLIKVPMVYFTYHKAIINRILLRSLNRLSKQVGNIERKHINLVRNFSLEGENGTSINLPNGIRVHKEYDYITITTGKNKKGINTYQFSRGKTEIVGYGIINCSPSRLREPKVGSHIIDVDALPEGCEWRYRREGDMFTPFKALASKKLKEYFIDKKVPLRLRDNIPLLAKGNQVYIIAGIEIADSVKVTDDTTNVYKITYKKNLI